MLDNFFKKEFDLNAANQSAIKVYDRAQKSCQQKPGIYNGDDLALGIRAIFASEINNINLLDREIYDRIYYSIYNWTPDTSEPEYYKLFAVQDALLNELVYKKGEQQKNLRSILTVLNQGLSFGRNLLEEELKYHKNDSPISKILKNALGKEPSWSSAFQTKEYQDKTLHGLSTQIQGLMESTDLLEPKAVVNLRIKFEKFTTEKILKPLIKYDKARGFLSRVKDWINDTFQSLLNRDKLSIKGTLQKTASTGLLLFKIAERKISVDLDGSKIKNSA